MTKMILSALVFVVAHSAEASSLVCSGETVYLSDVREDYGPKPIAGQHLSSHVIVFDRKVLLKYDRYEGLFPQGVPPYRVEFADDKEVISEENGKATSEKIFTVTGTLYKVDSITHKIIEKLTTERLVCRDYQVMVP